MQEMWIWSLAQEDSLKKEMATHSSILAWKIPQTGEAYQAPWSCEELNMIEQLNNNNGYWC